MNVREGDIIKHGSFSDVAILVKLIENQDGQTIISGHWLNQGQCKTYSINVPSFVMSIQNQNTNFWFKCKTPDAKCIRFEQWEQLKAS